MKDKTCVITGGTSGIGRATAVALARTGACIVLIGRNETVGAKLAASLRQSHGPDAATFVHADLADPAQVRSAAHAITAAHPRIDILINNAGARHDTFLASPDGRELTFATNHLGHFLLTALLLPALLAAPAARILAVTSGNRVPPPDRENGWLLTPATFDRRRAYALSKTANLVFTAALSARLLETPVTANACEPGGVASRFALNNGLRPWLRHLLSHALKRDLVTPACAAQSLLHLATSPSLARTTGRLFRRQTDLGPAGRFNTPAQAAQLWTLSCRLTSLSAQTCPATWPLLAPSASQE